ncbi:hypothetical protein [Rhodoferax fermentans]|uniref:Uncharacterized protein n=1 Tax=Rhodoferax fermentans TaxID=28066 RepID=A0A1T1AP52_RHOFE|nr:hypothetical protein [Rhodoferax fermentans]OOV05763.1 hypothetical protein RF819_02725 [Rhodoferax fermentans]
MASTKPETQLTWSAAASATVASASIVWSDPVAFNVEDFEASVQVSADNTGTPASGDVCNVFVAYHSGDILGDSGADFDTDKHAQFLMQLDTYSTNGEDPARKSAPVRTGATGYRLGVQCPQAATRSITVRARMTTHRAQ